MKCREYIHTIYTCLCNSTYLSKKTVGIHLFLAMPFSSETLLSDRFYKPMVSSTLKSQISFYPTSVKAYDNFFIVNKFILASTKAEVFYVWGCTAIAFSECRNRIWSYNKNSLDARLSWMQRSYLRARASKRLCLASRLVVVIHYYKRPCGAEAELPRGRYAQRRKRGLVRFLLYWT